MNTYVLDDRETPRFRVNRRALVDPEVLAEERRRIFDRCWLYVGHESEIPANHDYVTRDVGGRPLVLLRDGTGTVRVFINACTHRGTVLCRENRGNSRFLKCFYHAWSFDTTGRLVAIPDEESYGPTFDRENLGLVPPPRVESYRGFVFACYDAGVVDLPTYLAGARDYIDLICDLSADGMEIIRGSHQYAIEANWKLLVENSMDGYHGLPTHQRYFQMMLDAGMTGLNGMQFYGADLGGGHGAVVGNTGLGRPIPPHLEAAYQGQRSELIERLGPERASRVLGSRNVVIFPNLAIVDLVMGITVRTFWPVRPDYMEVSAWELAPRGEDPSLRAVRADNFLTFWGPAGLATPDDVEALECCQRGFAAHREAVWSDISRGMASERPSGMDELQMRAFWRRWNELLTDEASLPEPHPPIPTCWLETEMAQ